MAQLLSFDLIRRHAIEARTLAAIERLAAQRNTDRPVLRAVWSVCDQGRPICRWVADTPARG